VHDLADHQAYRNACRRQKDKPQQARAEGRRVTSDEQGNPEFKCEQGCGIVNEALTLQDIDNTFRQSDALGN